MPEDLSKLHEMIADLLDRPCYQDNCETKASRVRFEINPAWGFVPGKPEELSTEEGFLQGAWDELTAPGCYDTGVDPELLQVWCLEHFPHPTFKRTGSPKRRERLVELRQAAFDAYGRTCVDCGKTPKTEIGLRLCLADDQPQDSWAAWGVKGWNDRHEFLMEQNWAPGLCVVRCVGCFTDKAEGTRTKPKLNLRELIMHGYGGRCRTCGDPDQRKLWLIRLSGPILRWGDNGRKLTSTQKYKLLLKLGCPNNFGLICPECWAKSRKDKGNGYLSEGRG